MFTRKVDLYTHEEKSGENAWGEKKPWVLPDKKARENLKYFLNQICFSFRFLFPSGGYNATFVSILHHSFLPKLLILFFLWVLLIKVKLALDTI